MIERTRAGLVAIFSAVASAFHYLYLSRIPFLGLLALIGLPLIAVGAGRALALGAYDLPSNWETLFVGTAYGLAGGSIFFTARLIMNLCAKRFRLSVSEQMQSKLSWAWAIAIFVALLLNLLTILRASSQNHSQSAQLAATTVAGMLLAFAGVYWIGTVSDKFGDNLVYRSLVWLGIKVGLQRQSGYLYPRSQDRLQSTDARDWDYEDGQIRAVSYAIVVITSYLFLTARPIPPLVTLMLLLSLSVLVLTGMTFFWDRYRLPLLVILFVYFWLMGFCLKADHYYRIWNRPEIDSELSPSEVVGRATQQHLPLVIVAAAGGGIQSAAWTTSVLDQLGKRLAAEPGGGYDFPHSVRLISGVSGGSVGGMFYAETFAEPKPNFSHSFEAACASDLGPVVRGLLRQDLWRALAPFFVSDICDDRGRILEKEWCEHFDEKFKPDERLDDAVLSAWGRDALALKRPALVLNATIVETGEKIAISTVPKHHTLVGETEFTDRYHADIAISTAARLSATFPFISPTGRPTVTSETTRDCRLLVEADIRQRVFQFGGNEQHLVDGGYYENSGLVGAIEWLDDALTELTAKDANPKHYPVPHDILILTIDGFERPYDPEEVNPSKVTHATAAPAEIAHGVIYNLAAPLKAVINVRGSGQRSFSRRLLRMFQRRWALENINVRDVNIFFEVKSPENREEHVSDSQKAQALAGKKPAGRFYIGIDPGEEPLSWHLRQSEINELAKEWIGFSDLNRRDNYQVILDFFRSEAGGH
jgi:hypothetical protein